MCQMRIILKDGGSEKVVLENAATLKATEEGVFVSAIFEEPHLVPGATVSGIDFLQGDVTLTQTG